MLYVPGINKFFEEVTITALELGHDHIELKEIGGTYFLIEEYRGITKNVSSISDLKIALDIFNKKCHDVTMKERTRYAI